MTTKQHDLKQAIKCVNNADFSRNWDNCFENFNGDYVLENLIALVKIDDNFKKLVLHHDYYMPSKLLKECEV